MLFEMIHGLYKKGGQQVYSHTHTHIMQSSSDQTHSRLSCDIRSGLFQCFHPAYVIVWMETCLHNLQGGGVSDWVCSYSGRPDPLSHLWCWWSDPSSLTAGLLAESLRAKAATLSGAGEWPEMVTKLTCSTPPSLMYATVERSDLCSRILTSII